MLTDLGQSLIIAFAMYSALPCPRIDWTEKNMRWAMCFFPLIGGVIAFLANGWYALALFLNTGVILRSCVLCAVPVFVTGGIHLDGFLDTTDALSSHRSREEKLRILKDPSAGAFAVIGCCVYFILQLGAFSEISAADMRIAGLGFIISRAWSAIALVSFPKASGKGTLKTFSDSAVKKAVLASSFLYIVAAAAGMIILNPLKGCLGAGLSAAVFLYYKKMSQRNFGGITGDLAGWFVQVCELVMLFGIAII